MRAHRGMGRQPWNGTRGTCRGCLVLSSDLARSLLAPKWAALSNQRAGHHAVPLLGLTWYIPMVANGTFARKKKTDEAVKSESLEVPQQAGNVKCSREDDFSGRGGLENHWPFTILDRTQTSPAQMRFPPSPATAPSASSFLL